MKVIFLVLLFAVASCNQEPEEQSLEMNYNELIKCFTELSPLLPDLMEVIKLIKAGDWTEVVVKSIELVSKGYPIVKQCISAFMEPGDLSIQPITGMKCCKYEKNHCVKWCPITSPKI